MLESTPHTSKPSALVVDDETLVLMFLKEKLEEMGFDVSAAGTAEEALTITRSNAAFAVAFIDLGLPDRSGLELIAELKSLRPTLPIVIASGYGWMAARDLDVSHRAPPILSKPYDDERIVDILTDLGIPIPYAPAEE